MRPLMHPSLKLAQKGKRAMTAIALQAFGPFCAISERGLPAAFVLWNAQKHQSIDVASVVDKQWPECILIDQTTFNIIEHKTLPDNLLLPHKDLTFTLENSPLQYELTSVELVLLNEEHPDLTETQQQDLVIVSGNTKQAKQSIDFFALNGEGFNAENNRLTINQLDYLSMTDHRIFERTEVWQRASQIINNIKAAGDNAELRQLVADQAKLIVSNSGYWSVWATLLWQAFENKDFLARILTQSPDESAILKEAYTDLQEDLITELPGHGPHNGFPGTRPEWLG